MNKKLSALAISALVGFGSLANAQFLPDADEFSITTTFAYESEYLFRGIQLSDPAFQPSVEFGWGGAYLGLWTNQPIDDDDTFGFSTDNEIDIYFGYGFSMEWVSFDVGMTYYWYPEAGPGFGAFAADIDYTRELYVGAAFDVFFNPAVYVYYDFDLEAWTFEFSGGYSYDISEFVANSSLEFGAYLGFVGVDDLTAGFGPPPPAGIEFSNGWTYWGLTLDWVYTFTDYASGSIGVRYSGNNDGGEDDLLVPGSNQVNNGKEDNFWWGVAFTAGF